MKNFNLLLLVFCFFLYQCGESDEEKALACSNSFSVEFQNELNNIDTATAAFTQDQSTENCQALVDAYNSYLDALEDWEDCATELNSVTEWQAALDASRASLQTFEC